MCSLRVFCVMLMKLIAPVVFLWFFLAPVNASIAPLLLKPPKIDKLTLSITTGDDGTDQNLYFSVLYTDFKGDTYSLLKNKKLNDLKSGNIFESGDTDVFTFDLSSKQVNLSQASFTAYFVMSQKLFLDRHWKAEEVSLFLNDSLYALCHLAEPKRVTEGFKLSLTCLGGVDPSVPHSMAGLRNAIDVDYKEIETALSEVPGVVTPTINIIIDVSKDDTTFDYNQLNNTLSITTNYSYGPTPEALWYAVGQALIDGMQGTLSDNDMCLTSDGPKAFLEKSDTLLDEEKQSPQCIFREAFAQLFLVAMTEDYITSQVIDFRHLSTTRNTCYERAWRNDYSWVASVVWSMMKSSKLSRLGGFSGGQEESTPKDDTCPVVNADPSQVIADVLGQVAASKYIMTLADIESNDSERLDYPLCGVFRRNYAEESTYARSCWVKRQIACVSDAESVRKFWVTDSTFTLMADNACKNEDHPQGEILSGKFGLYNNDETNDADKAAWEAFYDDFEEDVEYGLRPEWDDCLVLGLASDTAYQYKGDAYSQRYYRDCDIEVNVLCESATDPTDLKITNDTYPLYYADRACIVDGNVNGRKKYYYPSHQLDVTLTSDALPSSGSAPGMIGTGGTKRKGAASTSTLQAQKKAKIAHSNADQINKLNNALKLDDSLFAGMKDGEVASQLMVYSLNVGAGSCHAVQCNQYKMSASEGVQLVDTESALVDCGVRGRGNALDNAGVKEALQDNDFFKDESPTIVVTHPDEDHFSHIQRLMLTKDNKVSGVDHAEHGNSYLTPESIYLGGYLDRYDQKRDHLKFKTWAQWLYENHKVPVNGKLHSVSAGNISKWVPTTANKRIKTFANCNGATLDVVTVNHINAAGVGDSKTQTFSAATSPNQTSAVLKLDYVDEGKNFFSTIFPGDATKYTESQVITDLGSWTPFTNQLLLSPHHGANTSSSRVFLDKIKPTVVIHSSGTQHRHPRHKVVQCIERDDACDDSLSSSYGGDGTLQWRDAVAAAFITTPAVAEHEFACGLEGAGYADCISKARQYTTHSNKTMVANVLKLPKKPAVYYMVITDKALHTEDEP